MKSKEDIKQQESTLNNQDLTIVVSAESTIVADELTEINKVSERIVEIPASVSNNPPMSEAENIDEKLSIDDIRLEIDKKISELETNEQYISLRNTINSNHKLLKESQKRIIAVKNTILYANKYVKELSDNFLDVLSATGWFDRYYDAVCLFDRAYDSNESLEWCEALRDSLNESILDSENKARKIRALFNGRITGGVFTLSVKTPYLRLKEDIFNEIKPIIDIQSRSFYNWLKKIENLSLTLRNYWLELHCSSFKRNTYYEDAEFHLEKVLKVPISQYVASYIDENIIESNDKSFYNSILNKINLFIEDIADIELFYKKQNEDNTELVKYLTEPLLDNFYKAELEPIYRIYDEIRLSINSLEEKYEQSKELKDWCSLLNSLAYTITSFLNKIRIYPLPELIIGESHIDNSTFVIENKPFKFFSFANATSATEAPSEELKDCVASVSKYGFYLKDPDDNIKIIRETTASVYN